VASVNDFSSNFSSRYVVNRTDFLSMPVLHVKFGPFDCFNLKTESQHVCIYIWICGSPSLGAILMSQPCLPSIAVQPLRTSAACLIKCESMIILGKRNIRDIFPLLEVEIHWVRNHENHRLSFWLWLWLSCVVVLIIVCHDEKGMASGRKVLVQTMQ
jgi:hypothetical protein